jgi:hypothetical protein
MDSRLFRVALTLLLALVALPVAAAARTAEPRVYTNADLEKLDPLPVDSDRIGPSDGFGWASVTEFLDREYARLDARRSHDLDRRLVEIEEEESADRRYRRGFGLVYPGYPALYANPVRAHKRGHAPRVRPAHARNGRIVPLHARPSAAQVQWSQAIQRSGRDAFPSRSGPSR